MKKPFAYVTAVWKGGEFTVIDQATVYCRKVYEAGFTPLCPVLYLPHFLRGSVPAEHKDGIDIGRESCAAAVSLSSVGTKSTKRSRMTLPWHSVWGLPPLLWRES